MTGLSGERRRPVAFRRAARCPVLVGREREVTILARAIGRLGEGAGSVTVLAGEAGIGKTRLAQRASELAGQAGVRVTVGRSDAAFSASPFRPLSEALLMAARGRPVPEADALRPYVAVLASLVPHWRAPGWRLVEESPLVVGEALLRVLGDLAAPRGLLMIVEDLHWADEASMEVLGFLTGHVRDQPLAVVATLRTGEARDQVAGQLEARGAETCRLGRLTAEQTAAMARACLGPPGAPSVPNELVLRVARAAEGLPLLVEDLLASGESGGEPRRYADTVRARLARLNPSDRASLSAAAILGRQFDWRVVAEVTGLTAAEVTQALARCASSQLVTAQPPAYQFRHALTREVILGEISLAERQQMSLAAADALARTPSPVPPPVRSASAVTWRWGACSARVASTSARRGSCTMPAGGLWRQARSRRPSRPCAPRARARPKTVSLASESAVIWPGCSCWRASPRPRASSRPGWPGLPPCCAATWPRACCCYGPARHSPPAGGTMRPRACGSCRKATGSARPRPRLSC